MEKIETNLAKELFMQQPDQVAAAVDSLTAVTEVKRMLIMVLKLRIDFVLIDSALQSTGVFSVL